MRGRKVWGAGSSVSEVQDSTVRGFRSDVVVGFGWKGRGCLVASRDEVWEENLPGEPFRIFEAHREGFHRQIGKKDIEVPGCGRSLHFYSGGLAGR